MGLLSTELELSFSGLLEVESIFKARGIDKSTIL